MCKLNEPHFHNDEAARKYLEETLWPNGPVCPHCGTVGTAYKTSKPALYRCAEKGCRKDFTVTVGTVFERSKIPLHKWLLASFLLCASKKGMSAHQLHRMMGITYKTAWFMAHRIREAMTTKHTAPLGSGGQAVEADETFWGNNKKVKGTKGRGYHHKMKVFALVERGGDVRSFHVPSVNAKTLAPILREQASSKARLMTDEASMYTKVGREFASHGVVRHGANEYAVGDTHTNTIESCFSLLKRGLVGTFHHVGEQHLQRYVNEFDFRWNRRTSQGYSDMERAIDALKGISGKRLTYRRIDA